jgi:hypothetical protein
MIQAAPTAEEIEAETAGAAAELGIVEQHPAEEGAPAEGSGE